MDGGRVENRTKALGAEVLVIGSGFGGAVASCRLALAGFDVTILERGRRFAPGDLPPLPGDEELLPDSSRWMYGHDHGLWDVLDLGPIRSVQAAGYGGGSLIYANVHLRAEASVFESDWPAGYSRATLDPFYDLAASMLDATPYPEDLVAITPKSRALERAAVSLDRADAHFRPPIAVNFESFPGGKNAFGVPQNPCTRCGACCSGCNAGAKNSLDHNYLAVAERAGARVRTRTEVVGIERVDPENATRASARYVVHAIDHLAGGAPIRFEADHVFLCAGAVHSTRLLAKSFGPQLPKLGRRFFGNADAIAMIYGADQRLEPTHGPTITGAIVHDARGDDRAKGTWFMVQDGGYTAALEHMFGALRAPLLGDRNRFLEVDRARPSNPPPALVRPRPEPKDPRGNPKASLSTLLLRAADDGTFVERVVPGQLWTFVSSAIDRLRASERTMIEKTIDGIPERVAYEFRRVYLDKWKVEQPSGMRGFLLDVGATIVEWLVGLSIKTEPLKKALVAASTSSFDSLVGLDAKNSVAIERAVRLGLGLTPGLGNEVDAKDPGSDPSRRLMLLAMGDDRACARTLTLRDDRLVATDYGDHHVYAAEETLFRDIARDLGGELRVNPLYAVQRETITVHGQGGCAMGDDASAVTDAHGAVNGFDGLYVLDAAAFPTPVGVNPSATICAVAERNIADFIAKHEPDPVRDARAAKNAPLVAELAAIAARWKRKSAGFQLDPPTVRHVPTRHDPVGIKFRESLRGFVDANPRRGLRTEAYVGAEEHGRELDQALTLALSATIPDIAAFLASRLHHVALDGKVALRIGGVDHTSKLDPSRSRLTLLRPMRAGKGRTMFYSLRGTGGFRLRGLKLIADDPGFDSWEDTTCLYVRAKFGGADYFGITRLSMEDFLGTMLPHFEATGTTDPSRSAWALATFGSFFFGNLQRVYLPMIPDLASAFGGLR